MGKVRSRSPEHFYHYHPSAQSHASNFCIPTCLVPFLSSDKTTPNPNREPTADDPHPAKQNLSARTTPVRHADTPGPEATWQVRVEKGGGRASRHNARGELCAVEMAIDLGSFSLYRTHRGRTPARRHIPPLLSDGRYQFAILPSFWGVRTATILRDYTTTINLGRLPDGKGLAPLH
ncbi:hypothetical protein B0T16DRAFT_193800 [Cercophora newfieldiana]|uniref:Uncharacterized protein n=1 Tax=Cercophora newfieldiana TaxID=92897 RepID=A0AA40CNU3_9PEZI|nr:hypothetical protein B0T16DRAFT_193800 [Cercophora newfieldiana]